MKKNTQIKTIIETPMERRARHLLRENIADILARGYLRYWALRRLTPRQFMALHKRKRAGENFDEMVDVLVLHKIP